ncbi:MAG TPA: FHA domain-containing protein [Mycobacteriales bacterium]|nr:FHA domain-containing protein [Mycobacteriales bacterium]
MTAGTLRTQSGAEAELRDGLTVGRAADAALRIEDDSVSREHAVVRRAQTSWTISDCGSRNGTMLNGTRIPMFVDCPLRDGDRLEFGAVAATVVLTADEVVDETKAMSLSSVRDAVAAADSLSPYQLQVVRCLAEPWVRGSEPATNAEIAAALGTPLAVDAIKAALRRAYVKTGLADVPTHTKRRELCRVAQDRRWL